MPQNLIQSRVQFSFLFGWDATKYFPDEVPQNIVQGMMQQNFWIRCHQILFQTRCNEILYRIWGHINVILQSSLLEWGLPLLGICHIAAGCCHQAGNEACLRLHDKGRLTDPSIWKCEGTLAATFTYPRCICCTLKSLSTCPTFIDKFSK